MSDYLAPHIEAVEDRISELEFDLAVEKKLLGRLKDIANNRATPRSNRKRRFPPRVGCMAERLLAELHTLGRPAGAAELAGLLEAKGYVTRGKRKLAQCVGQELSRSRIFRHISHGLYAMAETTDPTVQTPIGDAANG
jgi:hypothetical protein